VVRWSGGQVVRWSGGQVVRCRVQGVGGRACCCKTVRMNLLHTGYFETMRPSGGKQKAEEQSKQNQAYTKYVQTHTRTHKNTHTHTSAHLPDGRRGRPDIQNRRASHPGGRRSLAAPRPSARWSPPSYSRSCPGRGNTPPG
jgi:hypothetical protein